MELFLKAIPVAVVHPLAFAAYAIAAVLFLLAGHSLYRLRIVLTKISDVPPRERKSVIEIATQTKLPSHVTPEHWIRITRMRMLFFFAGAVLICLTAVTVVALTAKTNDRPNFHLNELSR
jgi:hypothetical protein